METLLAETTWYVAMMIQTVAIVAVLTGTVEAVVAIARLMVRGTPSHTAQRAVWLNFSRWLVAGLTFQLAADIVQTTFAPTWDELARVAVVAVTRTFLSYFLDRDIEIVRARQWQARQIQARAEPQRT